MILEVDPSISCEALFRLESIHPQEVVVQGVMIPFPNNLEMSEHLFVGVAEAVEPSEKVAAAIIVLDPVPVVVKISGVRCDATERGRTVVVAGKLDTEGAIELESNWRFVALDVVFADIRAWRILVVGDRNGFGDCDGGGDVEGVCGEEDPVLEFLWQRLNARVKVHVVDVGLHI